MHMGNYYLENNNLHKEQVHKRPGSVRISIIQLIEMEFKCAKKHPGDNFNNNILHSLILFLHSIYLS